LEASRCRQDAQVSRQGCRGREDGGVGAGGSRRGAHWSTGHHSTRGFAPEGCSGLHRCSLPHRATYASTVRQTHL
jgi:hypothetical protein